MKTHFFLASHSVILVTTFLLASGNIFAQAPGTVAPPDPTATPGAPNPAADAALRGATNTPPNAPATPGPAATMTSPPLNNTATGAPTRTDSGLGASSAASSPAAIASAPGVVNDVNPADAAAATATATAGAIAHSVLPVAGADSPSGKSISATINVDESVRAIGAQPFENRNQVTAEIEQRVTSAISSLDSLKSSTSGLEARTQADFDKATQDAAARRQDLQTSLANARNATTNNWDGVRALLAADYAGFAEAVARAEIAASRGTPAASATVGSTRTAPKAGSKPTPAP